MAELRILPVLEKVIAFHRFADGDDFTRVIDMGEGLARYSNDQLLCKFCPGQREPR